MPAIRIIAAVVDTTQLTLYKEDGQTVVILQGDDRLRPVLDHIAPILNAGGIAEYELDGPQTAAIDTTYKDYEESSKKAGGFTRFFRVLKSKVAHLLHTDNAQSTGPTDAAVYGTVPVAAAEKAAVISKFNPPADPDPMLDAKMANAIEDIMAHALPVTDPTFREEDTAESHTMIAVVSTPRGETKVIPDAQKLKGHLAHALTIKNTVGTEAFMQRLGAAISNRGHTIDDVLRFMEKGDLPVANDGTIIAYKVLTTLSGQPAETFFDCHTKKIPQKVGSFVRQDEKLIDPSRRTQCSTGLHIARRGYLQNFAGNIIVMVKIRPEDVIAVPHNEPNKIRVSGYHIICQIPAVDHSTLRGGRGMESPQAQRLLSMAISGDHIGIQEIVNITAAHGNSFVITATEGLSTAAPKPNIMTQRTSSIPDPVETAAKAKVLNAPVVDPKQVAKEASKAVAAAAVQMLETRLQIATRLYAGTKRGRHLSIRQDNVRELLAFRKKAKIGWQRIGLSTITEAELNEILKLELEKVAPVELSKPKPDSVPKLTAPTAGSRKERATKFTSTMHSAKSQTTRAAAAKALLTLKKSSKVSWDSLGVNQEEVTLMMKLVS